MSSTQDFQTWDWRQRREKSCMDVSIFNKACFFHCYTPALIRSLKGSGVNFSQTASGVCCSWPFSRGRLLSWRAPSDSGGAAENWQEGSDESSPSLQEPYINQINYGAATVSQLWRGNEMIRGNDAERVNEIINYLVIYWESVARARAPPNTSTHFSSQTSPTTVRICFNWVIIRLLRLAESLGFYG